MSSNFDQIRPRTGELAALEHNGKIPIDFQCEKCCDHSMGLKPVAPSFLNGFSSFLQVKGKIIQA